MPPQNFLTARMSALPGVSGFTSQKRECDVCFSNAARPAGAARGDCAAFGQMMQFARHNTGGRRMRAVAAVLALSPVVPSMAQEADTDATATLVQPLVITGAQPLEFGMLAIPAQGECIYEVDTAGRGNTPAGVCQFIGANQFPARFRLNCAASTLVQFQLVYTDSAPAGATFSAPPAAMDIDGNGAGALFQTRPCDTDGTSQISAAGRLTVRAGAVHGFSGPVGTIRLEVAYD